MQKADSLKSWLVNVVSSKKFLWGVVFLFVVQGAFLAFAIDQPQSDSRDTDNYLYRTVGVVPDGNRHMAAIYHFAKRPILDGPWVQDMTADELMMGDLVRFPSYFYYYLVSFPVRVALALNFSDLAIVTMVRLIGLLFGVLALLVFSRITRRITPNKFIQNTALSMLALTGSFAFLAPAENYDVLAFLFWLLFLLASIKLVRDRDLGQVYWMAVWFFLISITKYTYIPFVVLTGLASLVYLGYEKVLTKKFIGQSFEKLRGYVSTHRIKSSLLAVLMIFSVTLFAERIAGNLIEYQSFSPKCDRVHEAQDCRRFGVYKRNVDRLASVESGEASTKDYNFFEYTLMWISRYYSTTYYYLGHQNVSDVRPALLMAGRVAALVLSIMALVVIVKGRALFSSRIEWYMLAVVGILVVGQYLYNVMLFITYSGETYGHQGRYLLPAIGLIYLLLLLVVYRFYQLIAPKYRVWVFWLLVVFSVVLIWTNSALVNLIYHAQDPAWYSQWFKWLAP